MSGKNEVRNAILNADDLPRECVKTPEWPIKEVWVRSMGGDEGAAYSEELEAMKKNGKTGTAKQGMLLLVYAICDEQGHRIFRSADIPGLTKKNMAVLERLATAAMRVNGVSAEEVDRLEKKSETTHASDSG